jgi:phage gp36-like protein
MFLTKDDYKTLIKQDLLEVVISQDDTIRTRAELAAQAEIESYLRARYDVAAIFSAVADARHPQILMYMIDVALFHLHSRINPRNVPELRGVRYEQAIDWLKAVAKGNIAPDLPVIASDQPSNRTVWGSQPKANNFY